MNSNDATNEEPLSGWEVWEFECVNCGAFTFVTSGQNSTRTWAERTQNGASEWITHPDQCMVCGAGGRSNVFIWREHGDPITIGSRYRPTTDGWFMSEDGSSYVIPPGDQIPDDAWPKDNFNN